MRKLVRYKMALLIILLLALSPLSALGIGEECPTFFLPSLSGGIFNSERVLGKKKLLIWFSNFDENFNNGIPGLLSLYQKFPGDQVEFLIISVNGEDKTSAQKAMEEFFISFPILLDPQGTVCRKFSGFYLTGVVPMKNLFLVGRDKKIKLADHFPGIPEKVINARLKEME